MAKKGEPKPAPPKRFWVPANVKALGRYGDKIIERMRSDFNRRK